MPRLFIRRAALLGALAMLAACSDDSPALPDTDGPPELGSTGGVPSSIATRPRFQVDLQATGSFRPGQPVQLVMTVTGRAETADAELELVLPELASAQASGWGGDFRPLRAGRVPAAQSRRGAVGNGARTVLQEAVTFPVPGYYSVWASARARTADSIPDVDAEGNLLLDETHVVVYLLIDEQGGGRVTNGMDPRALPPTAVGGLGPLRPRAGVIAPPENLPRPPRVRDGNVQPGTVPLRSVSGPSLQTSGTVRLVVDYRDPTGAGRYVPLEGAEWYLNLYNSSMSYTGSRNGYLPADGSVSVGCGEAYYAELVVWAYSDRVSVGGASDFRSGQEVERYGFYPSSDCGFTRYTDAIPVPSHVFVGLNRAARSAQTFFGRSRPRTPAVLTSNTTIPYSTYCPPGTYQGCTFGGDDYLRIQTDSTTAYGQQIWGQTGAFITTHEYGHAYHEKALGGFIRYYGGCGTHSLTALATNMRCALPEGFADYFAVAVRPDETGYDYAWETNYYYQTYLANQDGSRSEGAIAAFFYDLTDNNRWGAETHDVVQYAGTVIADVIAGCQVYEGGTWIFNNGIDHLTYCFERRVDPAVTGSTRYFPTRSPDPTSYYVASTVTSATEVRKIWRRNLYNE